MCLGMNLDPWHVPTWCVWITGLTSDRRDGQTYILHVVDVCMAYPHSSYRYLFTLVCSRLRRTWGNPIQ